MKIVTSVLLSFNDCLLSKHKHSSLAERALQLDNYMNHVLANCEVVFV